MAKNGGKVMNVKYSKTEAIASESLTDAQKLEFQWKSIDWNKVENEVNNLQIRIAKAMRDKKHNKVKQLQYLLTHSFNAKLLAVRRVTTNKGKNTAGVDGVKWSTPSVKMKAVYSLTNKNYKAKPLRRVYIEKKGKKEKRPLGIPTMYDRAMQALYALTLDPVAEVTADGRSFGFRKGRCAQDACEYVFASLSKSYSAQWVLEGDIKGCFNNINHDWLMKNIPMDKSVLYQFLKAGFVYKDKLFPTNEGTPQGGIISPILANMALDGLQDELIKHFSTNSKGNRCTRIHNMHKVNLIRYADDFVITAVDKETAEKAKVIVNEFINKRGLILSEEKTLITHIDDGFDFLGWAFRKFKGKLIVKPSKKSIQNIKDKLSETVLRRGRAWTQEVLILKLNQQIRGWTKYHQSVCASEAFSHLDFVVFNLLYKWAKRRHPKKGKWWITTKYWHMHGNRSWTFRTENKILLRVDHTPIVRHTRVRMNANPYLDQDYFVKRKFEHGMKRLSGRFKEIWRNQHGTCYHCDMPMEVGEDKDIFFKTPKSMGGTETISNMAYVHKYCNALYFESRSKE